MIQFGGTLKRIVMQIVALGLAANTVGCGDTSDAPTGTQPNIDAAAPNTDATAPNTDAAPNADATAPNADATAPNADAARPDVEPTKRIVDLSPGEMAALCDAQAAQIGGYGAMVTAQCDAGVVAGLSSESSQAACVSEYANLAPSCPLTVGVMLNCLDHELTDICGRVDNADCNAIRQAERTCRSRSSDASVQNDAAVD